MKSLFGAKYLILLIVSLFAILMVNSNITFAANNPDKIYLSLEDKYYAQTNELENFDPDSFDESFTFSPKIAWKYRGNDWTENDLSTVAKSLHYISENIVNKNVRECIESRSLKFEGINSVQAFIDFDSLSATWEWPDLIITGKYENKWWAGMARLERILSGEKQRDFRFDFDSFKLNMKKSPEMVVNLKHTRDTQSRFGEDAAAKNLSGIILHELLHQMGHGHPATGDPIGDYNQGHFVVVAGDCLTTDGRSARGPSNNSGMYADGGYNNSGGYVPPGGWARVD